MSDTVPYHSSMSADTQVQIDEAIAALIFNSKLALKEDGCVEIAKRIVHNVLREFRPDLFEDYDGYVMDAYEKTEWSRCDNCGHEFQSSDVGEITHYWERVEAGGMVPSGACPECDALAYPIRKKSQEASGGQQ